LNNIQNDQGVQKYFTKNNGPPKRGDYIVFPSHIVYYVDAIDKNTLLVYGAHSSKGPDFDLHDYAIKNKRYIILTPK